MSPSYCFVVVAIVVAVVASSNSDLTGDEAKHACDEQGNCPPPSDAPHNQQEDDNVILSEVTSDSDDPEAMTSVNSGQTTSKYRLPGAVTPIHYQLELQPEIYTGDPATFTFNGSVTVRMRAEADTSQIVMHAHGLNVHPDTMKLDNIVETGSPLSIVDVTTEEETDFLILVLSDNIIRGREYLLTLTFDANLTDAGVGLYWSSYQDSGDTVYLAVTHLEPVYARRVFPCFDEPRMKATFDVTLVRRNDTSRDYKTFSNEDVMRHEDRGSGYVADTFRRTPRMSTYVLAFAVCHFGFKETTFSASRLMIRTLAPPDKLQYASLSQDATVEIFDFLKGVFDPPYLLTKLDTIALPDQEGAMENWGLVACRDTILHQDGVSGADDMEWAWKVTAHELIHMWFGNMVTPKWWSWLWMKEAIASFLHFVVVDNFKPEWRMEEQFVVSMMQATLATDQMVTSHPLTAQVESPSEIHAIFDDITYIKGAAIIRMLYHVMGPATFHRGVNLFLSRKQYDVAEPEDLWYALNDQMTLEGRIINITEIMNPWVTQMNYPVVHVTRSADHAITVTQQRFLSGSAGRDSSTAPYGYKWNIPVILASTVNPDFSQNFTYEAIHYKWDIPVTYTSSLYPDFNQNFTYEAIHCLPRTASELFIEDATTLPSNSDTDSWVIVNVQQLGYFRVNYDVSNWEALIRQLNTDHTAIHPINRAQIINDAWSLAKEGHLNLSIALRTLQFLKYDMDYAPWQAFSREVEYLDSMLALGDLYDSFRAWMATLVEPHFDHVGFALSPQLSPVEVLERTRFVEYACKYGVSSCVDAALETFNTPNMSTFVHPNLQYAVYCTAVQEGGEEEWNIVLEKYRQADLSTEKIRLLRSLACTKEPLLIDRLLTMALDPEEVKSQDRMTLTAAMLSNHVSRYVTYAFLRKNFSILAPRHGAPTLASLIFPVTTSVTTPAQLRKLEDYLAKPADQEEASAFTAGESNWLADNHDVIQAWLTSTA